jgi:ELWxxDGT repeat protein
VGVGNLVFSSADDGQSGRELWRTDGTAEGTFCVQDIYPGADAGSTPYNSDPRNLIAVGGSLYFGALNQTKGRELAIGRL